MIPVQSRNVHICRCGIHISSFVNITKKNDIAWTLAFPQISSVLTVFPLTQQYLSQKTEFISGHKIHIMIILCTKWIKLNMETSDLKISPCTGKIFTYVHNTWMFMYFKSCILHCACYTWFIQDSTHWSRSIMDESFCLWTLSNGRVQHFEAENITSRLWLRFSTTTVETVLLICVIPFAHQPVVVTNY